MDKTLLESKEKSASTKVIDSEVFDRETQTESAQTRRATADKQEEKSDDKSSRFSLHPSMVGTLAEEIAKTVIARWPGLPKRVRKPAVKNKQKKIENGIFLDTSAIIDGRIFEVITLGVFTGIFIVPESILLELKHIADSQDMIKRERGRGGLESLEKIKKVKHVRLMVLPEEPTEKKKKEVDEQLIDLAKHHKGKVITCDYNLEKKASINGVIAININALAQALKISAVPGEALHIKVLHQGKDLTQGVGYLDDGTMIVIEQGSTDIGKMIDVVVSRVIQTASGRILFSKKI